MPAGTSGGRTIGMDIGGSSVRAGLVAPDGSITDLRRADTPSTVDATEDLIVRMVRELAGSGPVDGIGLAVAGFVSADRTRVMFAPHLAWRDAAVPAWLAERTGLPVVMDHDVNCAAWAESRLGVAAGKRVALLVALGTGIGAGLVVDGVIYRGAHGVAPELGHVVVVPGGRACACGKRGCWERYCSGTALAATALEQMATGAASVLTRVWDHEGSAVTGALVAEAARGGDPVAREATDDLARWLGAGLAIAGDVLDPGIIVIGGGVSDSADLFLDRARRELAAGLTGSNYRIAPELAVARFGSSASLVGAALLARGQ